MFDDIRINFIKYVLIRNYSCHEDQIIFVKNRYIFFSISYTDRIFYNRNYNLSKFAFKLNIIIPVAVTSNNVTSHS